MKTTSLHLITAAIALFACAAASQAAPAQAKARTARVNEIHCNEKTLHEARPSASAPTADETPVFRYEGVALKGNLRLHLIAALVPATLIWTLCWLRRRAGSSEDEDRFPGTGYFGLGFSRWQRSR